MKKPLLQYTCPCTGIQFNKLLEIAFWGFLVLTLICIPPYLITIFPDTWNDISQVLFQVITAIVSILIGYRLSKAALEQQVTRKWLRPAQTACNQIQVMKAQVLRLRKTRRTTCDELQDLIAELDETQRQTIDKIVRTKCDSCKARLLDIDDHLSNSYETWRIFMRENCDKIVECDEIERELENFGKSLKHEDEETPY